MDLPTWFLLRAKIKRHHGYPHHPQQKAPAPVYDRRLVPDPQPKPPGGHVASELKRRRLKSASPLLGKEASLL